MTYQLPLTFGKKDGTLASAQALSLVLRAWLGRNTESGTCGSCIQTNSNKISAGCVNQICCSITDGMNQTRVPFYLFFIYFHENGRPAGTAVKMVDNIMRRTVDTFSREVISEVITSSHFHRGDSFQTLPLKFIHLFHQNGNVIRFNFASIAWCLPLPFLALYTHPGGCLKRSSNMLERALCEKVISR